MSDLRTSQHSHSEGDADPDSFETGWREFFDRQRDKLEVVRAVMRMTDAGAHQIPLDRLAAAVDRPVEEIRLLLRVADAGLPSLSIGCDGDQVWLDLATTGKPRFWLQIGDRRIGAAGCAPDIFGIASALAEPMRAEATCPATGTAITLEFTPDGVRDVSPVETVVAAINPAKVPEAAQLTDAARVDVDVCTQQVFFANAEAAGPWLKRHPGGRTMPVVAFDRWLRQIRTDTR
jgi:hypothetical protein